MHVERVWYESSPYLYASVGVLAAVYDPGPLLMKASAFVLLFAALTVIGLRWIYRRDVDRNAFDVDSKKYVSLVTQDLFFDALPTDAPSDPGRRRS